MTSQPETPKRIEAIDDDSQDHPPEHHLGLMRGGGQYWGNCLCGWKSGTHRLAMDVQLRFGEHLLETEALGVL